MSTRTNGDRPRAMREVLRWCATPDGARVFWSEPGVVRAWTRDAGVRVLHRDRRGEPVGADLALGGAAPARLLVKGDNRGTVFDLATEARLGQADSPSKRVTCATTLGSRAT